MKPGIIQRVTAALLSATAMIAAVLVLPYPVAAENGTHDSKGGYVPSQYFDGGTAVAEPGDYTASQGSSSSVVPDSSGKAFRLYSSKGTASASAEFDEETVIGDSREIGIYVRSLSDKTCTADFSVKCGEEVSTVSAALPTGKEYYIFTPLPDGAEMLTKVSLTITAPDTGNADSSAVISALVGSVVLSEEDHTKTAETFSAFSVSGVGKDFSVSSAAPVVASSVIADAGADYYAAKISLTGKGGGMAFHFAPDGENYGVYGSAVITSDRDVYLFRVGKLTQDSSYKIEFTGVEDSDVRLSEVEFIPMESHDVYDSLGTVTKCTVGDGSVSLEGSITRDTAVKYIDGEVCLYEIPMWQEVSEALKDDPALSIKMSTTFSFSLPVTEDFSPFTSYVVGIREGSEVHPLSDPIYPSSGRLPEAESSVGAVSGISPEDAFSVGADCYVIDLDLSKLFLDKTAQNSSVYTYDGYPYYPDTDVVSEIAKKVQFLTSAGIGVIFRMQNSISGSDPFTAGNCRRIAAAVSYIDGHFSPYGFITEAPRGTSLSDSAMLCASVARLVSAASGEDSAVYIPVSASGDCESFVWLLAEYLSDYPKASFRILLTDIPDDAGVLGSIAACAADGGYTSRITVSADSFEAVRSMSEVKSDISYLIDAEGADILGDSSVKYETYTAGTEWTDDPAAAITLWDFTASYDSGGFTVPAGPTAIFTDADEAMESYLDIPACRSLKTMLGGESHMITVQPSSPLNLTACPSLRFLMSAVSSSPFTLDIIFISGKERAIFTADFDSSGVYAPVCDLSGTNIAGRIDRIAIVLREGDPVELGIATVTAMGSTDAESFEETIYITEATITEAVQPTEMPDSNTYNKAYVAVGALIVITIVVFAVLSRKKQ